MGVILLTLFIFIITFVSIYNGLVKDKVYVKEAWSGIDVQLKRRHDLIPNIVETVKGYMQHEKNVLEEATRLRSLANSVSDLKEKAALENNITGTLKTIFALSENYPDLKADKTFFELQKNLTQIEDDIQLARRYYNGTVRNYNIKVQSFPSNIIAVILKFRAEEFFEIETISEKEVPEVQLDK